MSRPPWRLVVSAGAERDLDRLPEKSAPAMVEFMLGPLLENPQRVGHALRGRLAGRFSARRGGYRIIYALDEAAGVVRVIAIKPRADAYRLG